MSLSVAIILAVKSIALLIGQDDSLYFYPCLLRNPETSPENMNTGTPIAITSKTKAAEIINILAIFALLHLLVSRLL